MTSLLSQRIGPLMEKPGWQRVLILVVGVLILLLIFYLFGLRGIWRQHEELALQIATEQHVVLQSQAALLLMPSLKSLERELQESTALRQTGLPLAQQFAQPLKDSQAKLIRWQPASGAQGELHMQLSFRAMTHFLYALLQRPGHPVFSELSMHTSVTGLNASVLLTQTSYGRELTEDAVAVEEERDPFNVPEPSSCLDNSPVARWVLSGITHVEGRPFGWLLSPDGLWSKVEPGSQIGTPLWTVAALDNRQVELTFKDVRCGAQRQVIQLGKNNDSPGKGK